MLKQNKKKKKKKKKNKKKKKIVNVAGIGCIVRVLTDRNTV